MGLLDLFKRKDKNLKSKEQKISFLYINPFGQNVLWSSEDYETFADESYVKNVIAYQCIDKIAKCVSSVEWYIMQKNFKGNDEVIYNHYLTNIFISPNPFESFRNIIYKIVCYYLIFGNVFLQKIKIGNKIKELYVLRPDRVSIEKNSKGQVVNYIYKTDNDEKIFPVDILTGESEIVHIKSFHPLDDYFGLPLIKPCSKEIDIANEASRWNMSLMQNDGRPGMIVTVKGYLTDQTLNRLHEELKNKYTGADRAGEAIILESEEGMIEVKPYSWSPKELDFTESAREVARKIAGALGVPSMLLGIPGDNTYSNYKEARISFWEDTVIPLLQILKDIFSFKLVSTEERGKIYFDYDLENTPAMEGKLEILWSRQEKAKDILTINERREMLGYSPLPYGDKILGNASLLPIEEIIASEDITEANQLEEVEEQEETEND